MVNSTKFKAQMKKSGFSVSSLARRLGMHEITLSGKINSKEAFSPFSPAERFYLRHLFDITKEEEIEIFGKEEE